jgi:hypothetical protein
MCGKCGRCFAMAVMHGQTPHPGLRSQDGDAGRSGHEQVAVLISLKIRSAMMQAALMRVTRTMIEAARRAEFDYYQKGRKIGADRFIPTPDVVIRAMLEAAVGDTPKAEEPKPSAPAPRIVVAQKPRRKQ